MKIHHYYHAYIPKDDPNRGIAIARWHMDKIKESKLNEHAEIKLGVVGEKKYRRLLIETCEASSVPFKIVAEKDEGWEQVTLNKLYENRYQYDAVFYAHTKGAAVPFAAQVPWREEMTFDLLTNWKTCLDHLQYVEALSSYYVSPELFATTPNTIFAGNFWWCKTSHIRRLNSPNNKTRYDAEVWLFKNVKHPYPIKIFRAGWPPHN